jgi:acetylornithine aminotransferase
MKMFDVYSVHDISIVTGKGSWVYDSTGTKYLDMYGGHAVISVGHTNPDYVTAITQQINRLGFYSNSVVIEQQQILADKLGQVSGKDDYQLFLCNSGAEANENAFKLASYHTGRKKIISVKGAFHGRTSLAAAATDGKSIAAPVNETDNVVFTPLNDIPALERTFAEHKGQVAGLILEAIQGVAGILVATDEYIRAVRRLCNENGAIYIADEIQCGCGRTGRYFATDWAEVQADIYTMAKGIGNGFPMGALAIAPHIEPHKGMLGTTFGGNQLACVAGTAVATVIERDHLIQNALEVGEYLVDGLRKIHGIKEVRGKGLMIGVELNPDFESTARRLLFNEKVFVGSAGPHVIRLLPALNITRAEADIALEAIRKVLTPSC